MTITNNSRISIYVELASAAAVLLGLVFVGMELRQNQQMMRAQIRNDLSVGLNDVLLVLAADRELAGTQRRFDLGEDISPAENEQLWTWENAIFRYWENVHYQYRNDLYDETEFLAQRDAWRRSMEYSRSHRWHWCEWGPSYSPEFRADMNSLLPTGACDEFEDMYD